MGVTVVDAARGLAADGDPMAATDHLQQLMLSRLTSRLAPIYASATNGESMMPSESYVVPEENVARRPAELPAVPVPTALDAQRIIVYVEVILLDQRVLHAVNVQPILHAQTADCLSDVEPQSHHAWCWKKTEGQRNRGQDEGRPAHGVGPARLVDGVDVVDVEVRHPGEVNCAAALLLEASSRRQGSGCAYCSSWACCAF